MWIVVEYSENLVKSDYFGVISVFGEDSEKLGYLLNKMLNTLSIDMKTPNIWDFPKKLHSLNILCAEYSKNTGHLVQFFSKKSGNSPFCIRNINTFNILVGEISKKLGFSTNHNKSSQNICNLICGFIRV